MGERKCHERRAGSFPAVALDASTSYWDFPRPRARHTGTIFDSRGGGRGGTVPTCRRATGGRGRRRRLGTSLQPPHGRSSSVCRTIHLGAQRKPSTKPPFTDAMAGPAVSLADDGASSPGAATDRASTVPAPPSMGSRPRWCPTPGRPAPSTPPRLSSAETGTRGRRPSRSSPRSTCCSAASLTTWRPPSGPAPP